MSNKSVFCPECRKDVSFTLRDKYDSAELKGMVYNFSSKDAFCEECGSKVYVSDVEDENLKSLYDIYRSEHNIIRLEEVREIPTKYNIGKRPLSLLLGWGEQTFSRYFDGDIPAKQYSEILKLILSDPAYYLSLLEKGKDFLKSDKTYTKSKLTTLELLNKSEFIETNLNLVVDYMLSQCQDITHLSLQKALYYVQGFFFAFYGRFLFNEDCEAWVHGPVYRSVYNRYSGNFFDPIGMIIEPDITSMSTEEKTLVDNVVKHICCYSGKTLEFFTHEETPWILTRGNLSPEVPTNRVISKQTIGEYFISVKEKYRMIAPADIKDYTKDMFSKL